MSHKIFFVPLLFLVKNKTGPRLFLIGVFLLHAFALAQETRVAGKVKDAKTGAFIANVNIVVVGASRGTTTDDQGQFQFSGNFSLRDTLVFSHIGYQTLRVITAALSDMNAVLLEPKPVVLRDVEIRAAKDSPMTKEIPATVSTMIIEPVVMQAATDLGDFIQRDASVKIDETGAGQKFVSIRGSNADEVLVVYDGIRLNSASTNRFDLAQIDLANLEKIEIIKGSNTVIFGEGAFGGVVNIVPRKIAAYHVSASQRVGTYDARELALNLYRQTGRLAGAYAFSFHDTERPFSQSRLSNQSDFHTLWGSYSWNKSKLEGRYLRYHSNFADPLLLAQTDGLNNVAMASYEGTLGFLKNLKLSGVWKNLEESISRHPESVVTTELEEAGDRAIFWRAEKQNEWNGVHLTLAYEQSRHRFRDRLSLASANLPAPSLDRAIVARRKQSSFFGILKNRLDFAKPSFRYIDWDLSFRLDWVNTDRQVTFFDPPDRIAAGSGKQAHLNYKIGLHGAGQLRDWRYQAYVVNGANVKLPSLQQLFYFDVQPEAANRKPLDVEQNIGTEAGFDLEKTLSGSPTLLRLRKIKTNFAAFRNSYLDKITEITNKGFFSRPFNTNLARTTGLEAQLALELFEGTIEWNGAFLSLFISDPRVFKFKPKQKTTMDIWLRRDKAAVNGHFFYEGKQNALILEQAQPVANATLPARWDIDLSVQRALAVKGINGFLNLAVRNLRNSGRTELSGYFLQDRRWYISLGAQF